MPSRNTIKQYAPDSYYHIYNRGVEKRTIFEDELDYRVFLSYFKVALSPKVDEDLEDEATAELNVPRLRRLNLHGDIELLAFCLMPNHFHLLVYQKEPLAIQSLMRSTMTGYVMYFNKRHNRIGGLFQDNYKASLIDYEAYLMHISRYIHLNPLDIGKKIEIYDYSSYPYYLGLKNAEWLNPKRILDLHEDSTQTYDEFVYDYTDYKETLDAVKRDLAI